MVDIKGSGYSHKQINNFVFVVPGIVISSLIGNFKFYKINLKFYLFLKPLLFINFIIN